MSEDPIDELEARLFDVARQERPPAGAPERAVKAIRERSSALGGAGFESRWMLLLPLAAGLTGIALWLARHDEPTSPISAEPSGAFQPKSVERAPERPEPAIVPAPPLASAVPAVSSSKARAPTRSAPMTLADELAQLKRVESALGAGDAKRALDELDRYDRTANGQLMRAEATLLRIEALSRARRTDAAAALARRFVQQNPESPLVDRARSFIAKDPSAAGGQP